MIVCCGMDSTDNAFLRWPWKLDGSLDRNEGEVGGTEESMKEDSEFSSTVVAAEKDDSGGSLSRALQDWVAFKGPSCWAYSRRSESPICEAVVNPFDLVEDGVSACGADSSILSKGSGKLLGLVSAGWIEVGER